MFQTPARSWASKLAGVAGCLAAGDCAACAFCALAPPLAAAPRSCASAAQENASVKPKISENTLTRTNISSPQLLLVFNVAKLIPWNSGRGEEKIVAEDRI